MAGLRICNRKYEPDENSVWQPGPGVWQTSPLLFYKSDIHNVPQIRHSQCSTNQTFTMFHKSDIPKDQLPVSNLRLVKDHRHKSGTDKHYHI